MVITKVQSPTLVSYVRLHALTVIMKQFVSHVKVDSSSDQTDFVIVHAKLDTEETLKHLHAILVIQDASNAQTQFQYVRDV